MYRTQYPDMPRIDGHDHIAKSGASKNFAQFLTLREKLLAETGADIALFVDLDGGAQTAGYVHDADAGIKCVTENGKGRILSTLCDYRPAMGLNSVKPNEIKARLDQGYCGYKWWWGKAWNGGKRAKYGMIDDAYFEPMLESMEEAGMPLVALHLEAPWGNGQAQREALYSLLRRHPELIVIQAHFGSPGHWHGTPEEHAAILDRHPNLFHDISVTAQHIMLWGEPDDVRDFFIRYADRLLWGTDNMSPAKSTVEFQEAQLIKKCALQFEWLETEGDVPTQGIGVRKDRTPEFTPGLNLPREALEQIYWRNAVRLIPHVREAMVALGYPVDAGVPVPTLTPRAQRLLTFLPRLKPADLASLSPADRAVVEGELRRLGLGG